MSTTEQEKVIAELRNKASSITLGEKPKEVTKIDKARVWELAQKVGKHLSDDSLSAKLI